ncbi:hypothetical protein [Arenimonas sp.]|uniref:hypothetical protein n=1 Tax=Arenimonas sp. TaxID=1872635 RepID=UPI0025BFCA58|nr:hypothetical protein [Arenimonas sp.]
MRFATPLRRSLSALPLLAVAVAAFLPSPPVPAVVSAAAAMEAGCGQAEPVGALGLARMPGDLGTLGRRLRCAG